MTENFFTIPYGVLKLETPQKPVNPSYLRGFIGDRFQEKDILHNHRPDGSMIYRYPAVQYKKHGNSFIVVGIGKEGTDVLKHFFLELDELSIKDRNLEILSKELKTKNHLLQIRDSKDFRYRFVSPYAGLNEKNRDKYYKKGDRKEFLESILIGNILSFLKGQNLFIKERLLCDFRVKDSYEQEIKGNPFMVFEGFFDVNIDLPDWIGLGKWVSRGFGTVLKEEITSFR